MAANLSSGAKYIKAKDHTAAATTALNSSAVDMSGYQGVVFLTSFGTAATGNKINVAVATASGGSFVDLEGTSVTSGTSDEDVWVEVHRPPKQWVRLEAVRGTSSTLESVWAILYGARSRAVDNTATGTIIGEIHGTTASGTA